MTYLSVAAPWGFESLPRFQFVLVVDAAGVVGFLPIGLVIDAWVPPWFNMGGF